MPPVEHLTGLRAQHFPKLLRVAPTLHHGFDTAQQMGPADLAPPSRVPSVRTPASRYAQGQLFGLQAGCEMAEGSEVVKFLY